MVLNIDKIECIIWALIYHNTIYYTTLPNSSMNNDLPVSSSVITPMSPVVCACSCVIGVSSPHSSAMGCR